MRLREKLYDGLDMVAVVGPVSAQVLAALPEALAAHVVEPEGRPLRRRPGRGGRWGHRRLAGCAAVARDSVVFHDEALPTAELAVAAHRAGYRGLPVVIHVSGSSMAVLLPHDLFDGSAGWDLMARILHHLDAAPAGESWPGLRLPVLASVRASGLLRRGALGSARASRRAAETDTRTAPQVAAGLVVDHRQRLDGLRSVWIDGETTRRLRDTLADGTSPGRPRESLTMRLTGLVLDAAGTAVRPDRDLRVRINIDLRRYAPAGRQVHGPFSTSYPFGTLRTIDTSAVALAAGLARVLESRGPLWALVANLAGYVRSRVRHPWGTLQTPAGRASFDLGISILPARLSDGFWAEGEPTNVVMLFHPRQPYDPYVQIAHVRGGVSISLWDETGLVDGDVFVASLRDRLHRLDGPDRLDRPGR